MHTHRPERAPPISGGAGGLAALGRVFALAAALSLLLAACGEDGSAPAMTPRATATPGRTPAPDPYTLAIQFAAGGEERPVLFVEIADTPEERARGLMGRQSLPENAGMLFVWPEDSSSGFWMKDTLVPLSIAFIEAGGTVLHIEDMQPLDETLHYSPGPYRYAVEANQGWFAENGIQVGDRVVLPDRIAGEAAN